MAQIIKTTGEVIETKPNNGTDFSLEELQAIVGGYIEVDYDQRIAADHAPCDLWEVDTNVPKGFHWSFEEPKQLTIKFE